MWIDASKEIFVPFGQARQVKTRNNISGLDKTSRRRSNRAPVLVHLLARHVQSRIECGEPPAGVIGGQIEFVSQAQIHSQSWRNLPVVLNKKVVIPGALAALTEAIAKGCDLSSPRQEAAEVREINLASRENLPGEVDFVVSSFKSRAQRMISSQEGQRIRQSGHRWLRRVDVRRSPDNHSAGCRSNSDHR